MLVDIMTNKTQYITNCSNLQLPPLLIFRPKRKGEPCTLETGKLCYNAININNVLVLVYVQNYKRSGPIFV